MLNLVNSGENMCNFLKNLFFALFVLECSGCGIYSNEMPIDGAGKKSIIVVGAGIAGLKAAKDLSSAGFNVTVA